MTRFYTKKGDDGYTSLIGKGRLPKYADRIDTVGSIDEANAAIAFARTVSKAAETSHILLEVQRDLYNLMAEVAATTETAAQFRKIEADRVAWLETMTNGISAKVTIPDEFIIPGDSRAGAAVDLARTIVRRAERKIARLIHKKQLENAEILRYMNRLSSLCYVIELLENQAAGVSHPTIAKV